MGTLTSQATITDTSSGSPKIMNSTIAPTTDTDRIIALYFATSSRFPVTIQRKRVFSSSDRCYIHRPDAEKYGAEVITTCQLRHAWEKTRLLGSLEPNAIQRQIAILQGQLHTVLDYIEESGLESTTPGNIRVIIDGRSETPYAVVRALRRRMTALLAHAQQSTNAGVSLTPESIGAAMAGFIPQIVELALMGSDRQADSSTSLICAYHVVMDFRQHFIKDTLSHSLADSLLSEIVRRRIATIGQDQIAVMQSDPGLDRDKYCDSFPRTWRAMGLNGPQLGGK